jgi:hypothetical protein
MSPAPRASSEGAGGKHRTIATALRRLWCAAMHGKYRVRGWGLTTSLGIYCVLCERYR